MINIMPLNIKKGDVVKYVFLPQIGLRLNKLMTDGFSNLAYLMLLIYRSVQLIPNNHPYFQDQYKGKYTIRQVMGEAARNLKFDKNHIDQVIIFFALIAGIIILALQFIFMLGFVIVDPAFAQDNYGDFVEVRGNTNSEDIALRILSHVFGLNEFFGVSDVAENKFHEGLRGIFQLYSIGLLVIAAIIVIYFIFAILAETAQTGTPFGKRYNHVWAPIRLVVAIGLLIPISEGLNSGQWVALYAAKFGSGFATNGWNKFNEKLNDSYVPTEKMIAKPNIQAKDFTDMAAFFMIAHACKAAETNINKEKGGEINAYLIKNYDGGTPITLDSDYFAAINFIGNSDTIRVRIGIKDKTEYPHEVSNVSNQCGEITMKVPDKPIGNGGLNKGGPWLNAHYYILMQYMWQANGYEQLKKSAEDLIEERLKNGPKANISVELKENTLKTAQEFISEAVDVAVQTIVDEHKKDETKEYEKYGWGGAGIWYNKIAEMNGDITSAALNKPQITTMPKLMEYVCAENRQQNNNTSIKNCYEPNLAEGREVESKDRTSDAAKAYSDIYDFWYKDPDSITGNAIIDTINAILGTQSLFDMCKNADIHPLAQLSTLGKGLVEAAIRNLGYGVGLGIGSLIGGSFGPALSAGSSFLTSIASISILMGFILFYIVPFMPFLYFLFAVGGWVKGLFEAMVGIPLWALAHIRIDGEGLPGDAANAGYFLIFEIFVRPILIVFGLLASLLIFSAMVKVLNEIFYLAVSNLSGFDPAGETLCGKKLPEGGSTPPVGSIDYFRGPVDEFFFTIVYAILVYMIGMSSFKLIDMIPNQILRWMGAGVATFNDSAGEPAEGIVQKIAIGGGLLSQVAGGVGGNLTKSLSSGAKGVGQVFGK